MTIFESIVSAGLLPSMSKYLDRIFYSIKLFACHIRRVIVSFSKRMMTKLRIFVYSDEGVYRRSSKWLKASGKVKGQSPRGLVKYHTKAVEVMQLNIC